MAFTVPYRYPQSIPSGKILSLYFLPVLTAPLISAFITLPSSCRYRPRPILLPEKVMPSVSPFPYVGIPSRFPKQALEV